MKYIIYLLATILFIVNVTMGQPTGSTAGIVTAPRYVKTDSVKPTLAFNVIGNFKATGTITTPLTAGTVRSSAGGVLSVTPSDTAGLAALLAAKQNNSDTATYDATKKYVNDSDGVRQRNSDTATWDASKTFASNASNISTGTLRAAYGGTNNSTFTDQELLLYSEDDVNIQSSGITPTTIVGKQDRSDTATYDATKKYVNDSDGVRQRNSDSLSWDASKTFASNASNLTSGTVGTARLGTGVADASTVLLGNGTWGPAVYSGGSTYDSLGVSSEGAKPVIKNTWYNNTTTNSPLIMLRKATNTTVSPTLVTSGHYLGTLAFGGYGTSQWMNVTGAYAGISGIATENFSNTNMGTKLVFQTYANSAGGIKSMTMEQDGSLTQPQSITTPLVYGNSTASATLTLNSTSHATKGKIFFGANAAYDENNTRLGIGLTNPSVAIDVVSSTIPQFMATNTSKVRMRAGSAENGFECWKDATPTKAIQIGMGTQGSAITDDIVFSRYNGSAWAEIGRMNNATSSLSMAGKIGKLMSDTTEGKYGVPLVVDTVMKTNQTASIAATNFTSASTAGGMYEVTYYLICTTASGTATVTVDVVATDGVARTQTSASVSMASTSNMTSGTFMTGLSTGSVQWQTTVTGTISSAQYKVAVICKRVF